MAELFLSDDPPPRKGRPRWLDGAGLGGVVAVMLAVGVLGDRGPKDQTAPAPTTTTSTTSPFRTGTPYDQTTTTEAPTTTTSVLRLGPLLPFQTDTVLLLNGGSTPMLVDVDAGTAMRIPVANSFGALAVGGGFVLPGQGSFQLLPSSGLPVTTVAAPVNMGHNRLMAGSSRTFWTTTEQLDGVEVVELGLDGAGTGRKVVLPVGAYVAGALDGALVVNSHGSLTLVDHTGRRRALGTGDVVAARGRTVARQSCALLRCRVELVDTVTGRARVVPELADVTGYLGGGAFSPDGRWLAYVLSTSGGGGQITVLDTAGGESWSAPEADNQLPFTFSPDSRVLFSVNAGQVCARVLATGDQHCLEGLGSSGAQEIVATAAG
ncbi:MAG: hypothetical protein JWN29_1771 [Acidimicrobiales bacterium]|nr:hypothetical protein [Acidimicrobiales bacterium]